LLGLIASSAEEDEDALTSVDSLLAHGVVSLVMALTHCSFAWLHVKPFGQQWTLSPQHVAFLEKKQ